MGFPSYCQGIPVMLIRVLVGSATGSVEATGAVEAPGVVESAEAEAISSLVGSGAEAVELVVAVDWEGLMYVKCAGRMLMAVRHCRPCGLW